MSTPPSTSTSSGFLPTQEKDRAKTFWAHYQQDPCEATAVALVEHYLPLVRRTVRSMAIYTPPSMDQDDLLQHALMGLWSAIERFDHERGVRFEAYALPRIRGSVRDALRRHDPLSRTDRAFLKDMEQHTRACLEATGNLPNEEQLADALDTTVARIHDVSIRAQPWLSLDSGGVEDAQAGDTRSFIDALPDEKSKNPEQETVKNERIQIFRRAFRRLSEQQQKVLYLYYYEDFTLKEIGTAMDLTEARICQVHAAGLLALRSLMSISEESEDQHRNKGRSA